MTLRFLYLFLSLLLLASCGDSRREDITQLVKLWRKEITIPIILLSIPRLPKRKEVKPVQR